MGVIWTWKCHFLKCETETYELTLGVKGGSLEWLKCLQKGVVKAVHTRMPLTCEYPPPHVQDPGCVHGIEAWSWAGLTSQHFHRCNSRTMQILPHHLVVFSPSVPSRIDFFFLSLCLLLFYFIYRGGFKGVLSETVLINSTFVLR